MSQVGDFSQHLESFQEAGVRVFALTAEDEAAAREMTEQVDVRIPIIYGLDPFDLHERLGINIYEGALRPPHFHASAFILKPDGTVGAAVYASGPVGRLEPEATLGHLAFRMKNA